MVRAPAVPCVGCLKYFIYMSQSLIRLIFSHGLNKSLENSSFGLSVGTCSCRNISVGKCSCSLPETLTLVKLFHLFIFCNLFQTKYFFSDKIYFLMSHKHNFLHGMSVFSVLCTALKIQHKFIFTHMTVL